MYIAYQPCFVHFSHSQVFILFYYFHVNSVPVLRSVLWRNVLWSFSLCIFCGKKDESFTEDGLDLHYWKHCPMLRRCDECRQVDWYIFKNADMFSAQLFNHYLCNEARRLHVHLCVVFTGSWDCQPHRAPTGWMWKQVQVQPVPRVLRGRGHWRSDWACPESHLQPWVFTVTLLCHWKIWKTENVLCDEYHAILVIFFIFIIIILFCLYCWQCRHRQRYQCRITDAAHTVDSRTIFVAPKHTAQPHTHCSYRRRMWKAVVPLFWSLQPQSHQREQMKLKGLCYIVIIDAGRHCILYCMYVLDQML